MCILYKNAGRGDLLFSVDDEFASLGHFFAFVAADVGPTEVDAVVHGIAGAGGEIPGDDIEAAGTAAGERSLPEQAPREVRHLDGELAGAARTVVGEHELGGGAGGVIAETELGEAHALGGIHDEGERLAAGVVEHIPGAEGQLVLAGVEGRDTEGDGAAAVVADIADEIVVEVVGAGGLIIDDEFEVVPYPIAGVVDAALVLELCHEEGRSSDDTAVLELIVAEHCEDLGADGVVEVWLGTSEEKVVAVAVGLGAAVVGDSIEEYASGGLAVFDVEGYGT